MHEIKTDHRKYDSIKEIKDREKKERIDRIRQQCEKLAQERFGPEKMAAWSNQNKGLWFLPIMKADNPEEVELFLIMKPINRGILSYASMKIQDEGLYSFLEACMRECKLEGDEVILDEDEFFIPAANRFNNILEGRKAEMLKR
jgi:hypothetical protein